MNKGDLISAMAAKVKGLSRYKAAHTLDAALDTITASLKRGEKVALAGFGTFSTSTRRSRMGRNPRTGQTISIAGRRVPRFKAGKGLKDAVK